MYYFGGTFFLCCILQRFFVCFVLNHLFTVQTSAIAKITAISEKEVGPDGKNVPAGLEAKMCHICCTLPETLLRSSSTPVSARGQYNSWKIIVSDPELGVQILNW